MKTLRPPIVAAIVAWAAPAFAADLIHYWDFDTQDMGGIPIDVAGGLPTSAVGTPDVSVHAIYGEAYLGAGKSLNVPHSIANHLLADTVDAGGTATAMDFGSDDFSFSYWSYDASDLDGDPRGPRIFDCLQGTTEGIQLASDVNGNFNLRTDDDLGSSVISNDLLTPLPQADGQWIQISVNVSRSTNSVEVFFDGTSRGSYDISTLTGDIFPSQDLQIGVINNGDTVQGGQQSGLDDLAFYTGLLSQGDIDGLADGTLQPDTIGTPPIPLQITHISMTRTSDPVDNILASITFSSKDSKTYKVLATDDLGIPVDDRSEIDDNVEGEPGSTTFEFDFNTHLIPLDSPTQFIVVKENPPAPAP